MLHVSIPDHVVSVAGDPTRLEQVVANLLDNASKYTPESGSVWLTLTVDDGDAVIKVRDTGPGVPIDRQESIFEPFTQEGPAARQGGLGIGLSLVKRIVELHRGSVDVGSTEDGAEFTVRLPITDEIPPVPAPARVTVLRQRIVVIEARQSNSPYESPLLTRKS